MQRGTNSYRPTNTESVKELQERLSKLQQERVNQDRMWDTPVQSKTEPVQQPNKQNQPSKIGNV